MLTKNRGRDRVGPGAALPAPQTLEGPMPDASPPTWPMAATTALVRRSPSFLHACGARAGGAATRRGRLVPIFPCALAFPRPGPQAPACTAHLKLRASMQQHSSTQGRRAPAAQERRADTCLAMPLVMPCLPGWCSNSHLHRGPSSMNERRRAGACAWLANKRGAGVG